MKFGKKITHEMFRNGDTVHKLVELEESLLVADKAELMKEILSGLELVHKGKTFKLTLEIYADDKGPKRIVKRYLA